MESVWQSRGFLLGQRYVYLPIYDQLMHDTVMDAKMWFVANKPLILRRLHPVMQLLKLSLSAIPI